MALRQKLVFLTSVTTNNYTLDILYTFAYDVYCQISHKYNKNPWSNHHVTLITIRTLITIKIYQIYNSELFHSLVSSISKLLCIRIKETFYY